ncbi:aldose epimerase family protein [Coleofasciculus sp. E1-EBD-02]|uniref:aldose epimerase family protein n=1 Tax=Coleofasciculus sp. E1-EBD-02 TaxID=3068481 RepID=UPI0033044ADD
MFAIALKQEQYSTYILTAQDSQSRLEVVPERGGLISHWSVQGQDILYFDAERFRDPTLSVRGGIPILFPICGNLPDNTYTHKGKQYQLKQHGFARDLPWQVTERVTDDLVSLTLVLNSNDQTRAVYPFDWQLTFTYQLQGNTLTIFQHYTNQSSEVMPFSTGLHPYFLTSDKTQLQFEIPAAEYRDQLTGQVSPFTGGFDWSEDEIDVAFRQVTDQSATVTDQQRRLKLTLSYDELYSTLVFWTVKGKDYYCLEPWSAPRNALNTGEDLTKLAPGESLETSVQLNVTFF